MRKLLLLAEVKVIPRSSTSPGTSSAVSEPQYRNPGRSPIGNIGSFQNFIVPFWRNRHKKTDELVK